MGRNYYLIEHPARPPCKECGRPFDQDDGRLHVGKSSAGWVFFLHVDPSLGINDLPDWVERWSKHGVEITDEYGLRVTCGEMHAEIVNRGRLEPPNLTSLEMAQNFAVYGPNNLLRHALGHSKIKHGAGTWDCIEGEFC